MENKKYTKVAGILLMTIMLTSLALAINPNGPQDLNNISTSQRQMTNPKPINISGGEIATMNLSGIVQNVRWKAFVGNVSGTFTLDDSTGSSIYVWSITNVTGRVYASRNSSTVDWPNIACATGGELAQENIDMQHSNSNDNISKTFNTKDHPAFYVGPTEITEDDCYSINTYVNNESSSSFYEMALNDNINIIYATILEQNEAGYNGHLYDFQMMVPENGAEGFTGSTTYYMYVELGNDIA